MGSEAAGGARGSGAGSTGSGSGSVRVRDRSFMTPVQAGRPAIKGTRSIGRPSRRRPGRSPHDQLLHLVGGRASLSGVGARSCDEALAAVGERRHASTTASLSDTSDALMRVMSHWRQLGDFRHATTARVLNALEDSFRALHVEFNEHGDPDLANEDADHLMGIGLVTIQLYLGEVALILRDLHEHDAAIPPKTTPELVREYGETVAGTTLRDMECVWHLANFFKHRDEWDGDWDEQAKRRQSLPAIAALRQLGITEATENPFLAGASRIGADYSVEPLLARAVRWREACFVGCGCPTIPLEPETPYETP